MRLFQRDEVVAILARAYGAAAGRDADMRTATDVLERLREALLAEDDPFSLWILLDNQVGRAEVNRLLPVLRQLRDECTKLICDRLIERVAEAFCRDAGAGWALWVWVYVRAMWDCDALLRRIGEGSDAGPGRIRRTARSHETVLCAHGARAMGGVP